MDISSASVTTAGDADHLASAPTLLAQSDVPTIDNDLDVVTKNINQNVYSVDVSIEPNQECEIFEIKYDGQEVYKE
jgi:preprotein translocase subunit SecB